MLIWIGAVIEFYTEEYRSYYRATFSKGGIEPEVRIMVILDTNK